GRGRAGRRARRDRRRVPSGARVRDGLARPRLGGSLGSGGDARMIAAAAQAGSEAAAAAPAAGAGFNLSDLILGPLTHGPQIEIPMTHTAIPLPQFHIGAYDFSITRNVVMLWVASALLLSISVVAARKAADPVPKGWRNLLEVFIKYFRDEIARKLIGHHADRY